jgi:maltose alpha-D-glucosyltransferase/alpha-amylase
MQWGVGKNRGFSDAEPERLYLPVDPAPGAPSVEEQEKDPASLLNTVRTVIGLRHAERDLHAGSDFSIVYAEKGKLPFVYRRGSLLLAVNPGLGAASAETGLEGQGKAVYALGKCALEGGVCRMEGQSCGIWRL